MNSRELCPDNINPGTLVVSDDWDEKHRSTLEYKQHKWTQGKPSAEAAVERAARAIRTIRNYSNILADASEVIADGFDSLDAEFRVLRATDDSEEVRKLHARIERLRELRNMMELGLWQIQINRAMDEVWQRLP